MPAALLPDARAGLRPSFHDPLSPRLRSLLAPSLAKLSGSTQLEQVCRHVAPQREASAFAGAVLNRLAIGCAVETEDLARIPPAGSLVVVANRPSGVAEALTLIKVLTPLRPDLRVLVPREIGPVPELEGQLIRIDSAASPAARRRNASALRQAIGWVREGGVLAIFPATAPAHRDAHSRRLVDSEWDGRVGRLIRHTAAPAVPIRPARC